MKKFYISLILLLFFSVPSFNFGGKIICWAVDSETEITGEQLYQEGEKLMEMGRYTDAIACLEKAAQKKANFAQAYFQLGICYMRVQDIERARQNFKIAGILTTDESLKQKAQEMLSGLPTLVKTDESRDWKDDGTSKVLWDIGISGGIIQPGYRADKQPNLPGTTAGKNLIPGGFLIQKVRSGSFAERAGLKKGDVITKIGERPVTRVEECVAGLQNFKFSNRAILVEIAGEKNKEIGWPPVVEELLADTQLEEIEAYRASAERQLKDKNGREAMDNFDRALASSIHYPFRADIYLSLAKIYVPAILPYWQKELPQFPSASTDKSGSTTIATRILDENGIKNGIGVILRARGILSAGEKTYETGARYYEACIGCLKDATIELKRNGGKSMFADFATEEAALETQLTEIAVRYAAKRMQEIQDFRNKLAEEDFTQWLVCSGKAWWTVVSRGQFPQRGPYRQPVATVYQPRVDVTFRNLSSNMDLDANGEIQFIDDAGRIIATSRTQFVCPARGTRSFLIEGTRYFRMDEVWNMTISPESRMPLPVSLKVWKVKVVIGGVEFGEFVFR
jgi:tetratricopeptide (TPR) repeat protein